MAASAQQRLQALSSQLNTKPTSSLPEIKRVAGDSTGQRLKGKVAVITGANSPLGIGRATAHQFAANGVKALVLCDFVDTYLSAHVEEVQKLCPSVAVSFRQFDAGDERAVKSVVEDTLKEHGQLDIFFANAGVTSAKHFKDISADEFMNTLRINTLSVFLGLKYASKAMLKTSAAKPTPGGSFIGTASVAGLRSNAGPTDYSASKAAVVNIVQTAAYQLAGTGVRCNAICPGLIETGMTSKMYEAARAKGTQKRIGQLNPLQRGGEPDEIARAVLFLASDEASYVNGQAWAVDGGLSAGHPFVPGKLA